MVLRYLSTSFLNISGCYEASTRNQYSLLTQTKGVKPFPVVLVTDSRYPASEPPLNNFEGLFFPDSPRAPELEAVFNYGNNK